MPLPFALLLGWMIGAAFAWIASAEIGAYDGATITSRSFLVVLAFAVFVWLPVLGYFVAFHGDWSYLYLVSSRHVPSALALTLVLLVGAAVPGAFCVAVAPMKKRRLGPWVAMMALPGALLLAALPWAARRLTVSGTFAQFHGDFGTEPIVASLLGRGVLIMAVLLAGASAWTARSLVRLGSTARSHDR